LKNGEEAQKICEKYKFRIFWIHYDYDYDYDSSEESKVIYLNSDFCVLQTKKIKSDLYSAFFRWFNSHT
jgi:hypothetical protein